MLKTWENFILDEIKLGFFCDLFIMASTEYGPYYVLDSTCFNKSEEYPAIIWLGDDSKKKDIKVANENFCDFSLEGFNNLEIRRSLYEDD